MSTWLIAPPGTAPGEPGWVVPPDGTTLSFSVHEPGVARLADGRPVAAMRDGVLLSYGLEPSQIGRRLRPLPPWPPA